MSAASHNPAFAAKVGIPQGVAQEFHTADLQSGAFAPHLAHMPGAAPVGSQPGMAQMPKVRKGAFARA
jgi:hypothetical protein